jgi:hypothetical protein
MKNKLTVVLSTAGLAALCVAATTNSQSGGLPALSDRLAALESVALAQAGRLTALESLGQEQAQEIETLKQQLAAVQPSPFTEAGAGRLKDLSGAVWVHKGDGVANQVFVDGSLLVRRTCFMSFLYSRGGNVTSSWTLPNEAGWTFLEWQ